MLKCLKAGMTYFLLVFVTGFVLGSIRVPFLVPRFGVRIAELLEMPLMLVVIVLSARWVVGYFTVSPKPLERLSVGVIALALMLAAEISLVLLLQGITVSQYLASRDPVSGSVYAMLLLVYGLMPLCLRRRPKRPTFR